MDKNFDVVSQLCEVIIESEQMANEVMDHLDIILDKLNNLVESNDLQSDIDSIRNNVHITLESMQAQDMHRQKIERVINNLDPENGKFAASAHHLQGDDNSDVVSDDELAALIAAANN